MLLPETALHTAALTARLEAAAGMLVLTATQVTLWSAFAQVNERPYAPRSGPLFAPGR